MRFALIALACLSAAPALAQSRIPMPPERPTALIRAPLAQPSRPPSEGAIAPDTSAVNAQNPTRSALAIPAIGSIRFPRRPPPPGPEDNLATNGPASGPPVGLAAMAGMNAPMLSYVPRALPTITHGGRSVADTTCLPDSVLRVLSDVSNRFGPVNVTSTLRTGRGRSYSMHRFCRAADFRVEGVQSRAILNFLRARGDVGGLKLYRNGLIHIDDSFVRSW